MFQALFGLLHYNGNTVTGLTQIYHKVRHG